VLLIIVSKYLTISTGGVTGFFGVEIPAACGSISLCHLQRTHRPTLCRIYICYSTIRTLVFCL